MVCAHKSAPSSRPAVDPLSRISLDLQGWTPCMPISACLSELRSSSGQMKPVLGGASQSAAPRCAGSVANRLRHSQLGAAYAALGLDDRPTQRGAALCSGAGAAPPKLYRMLGHAFSRVRSFIRVRLPRRNHSRWGVECFRASCWTHSPTHLIGVGGPPIRRKRKPLPRAM